MYTDHLSMQTAFMIVYNGHGKINNMVYTTPKVLIRSNCCVSDVMDS